MFAYYATRRQNLGIQRVCVHVQGIQKIKLELYKKGIQRGDIHSLLVSQGHTGTCTVCKQRGFQYVIQGVIEVSS